MYWIVTDSATDLPKSYIDAQEQFQVLPITITLEGQTLGAGRARTSTPGIFMLSCVRARSSPRRRSTAKHGRKTMKRC